MPKKARGIVEKTELSCKTAAVIIWSYRRMNGDELMAKRYCSDEDVRLMKRLHKKHDHEYMLERKNNKVSELIELAELRFKHDVPLIENEPSLDQYDLPQNVEELIETEKMSIEKKKKHKDKIIEGVAWLITVIVGVCFFYKIVITYGFWVACVGVYFIGAVAYGITLAIAVIIFPDKKVRIQYEEQYRRYEDDMLAYQYWQIKKSINYWDSLDGHAFEKNVASLFIKQGYNAKVSKQGGDGGIDIVLTKNDERIAVQCKAHNKAVAPSVARDLYGTMVSGGFEKGMIVSKNGFTKGVFSFVRDKNIELVDLDDIISMAKNMQ